MDDNKLTLKSRLTFSTRLETPALQLSAVRPDCQEVSNEHTKITQGSDLLHTLLQFHTFSLVAF